MYKVSDAVAEVVNGSDCIRFGLHHGLLNLSQVARFILPLVEARARKPVRSSAVLMALSRLRKRLPVDLSDTDPFYVDRINVHSGLASLTVAKTEATHGQVHKLYSLIQSRAGYVNITEGNAEITLIIEREHWPLVSEALTTRPLQIHRTISGIGVKFKEQYVAQPGLLYQILQQLALQRINVVEISSTMSEFNIYVEDKHVMLAFDSVYKRFSRPSGTETH